MIETITLKDVLPRVFEGLENEPKIRESQVWLREVSFKRSRNYLIEAESGTGKSSLCSFIYGNRHDYMGKILMDGVDISTFDMQKWCDVRTYSLALLPQEMRLFPELTAMENIMIKNRLTGHKTEEQILQMLDKLEIADKADRLAAKLSVGQQQRVAIVRSLCQPFDFLILDEPVSHLDSRNNGVVASLVLAEAQAVGASIIATSVGNKIEIPVDEIIRL
jgi:ABC-type lipoprotein export system ATPase subunit